MVLTIRIACLACLVGAVLLSGSAWAQSADHTAHKMQLVIIRDAVNAGGVGAIGAKDFADDTANGIRGAMDEVFSTHQKSTCARHYESHAPKGVSPSYIPTMTCIVAVGEGALQNATTMDDTIAIGHCSGASLTSESGDMLIGDYTSAPKGKDGFVNIGNKLCFWRDNGDTATCPPPEPECVHYQPKDTK
jgi:hypothetical protein